MAPCSLYQHYYNVTVVYIGLLIYLSLPTTRVCLHFVVVPWLVPYILQMERAPFSPPT